MAIIFLMHYDDKTVFLVIESCFKDPPQTKSNSVCNLGVICNQGMTMEEHLSYIVKADFFHIYNISIMRKYLTPQATETLIHAYISSRLDYCNSLCMTFPNISFRLQHVLNTAARISTFSMKHGHITPILYMLH